MRGPVIVEDRAVLILVRVTPNGSKDIILGLVRRGDAIRLSLKVRAAPHDGAANAAVLRLIAKSAGLQPAALSIAAGGKDRDKTIRIVGGDVQSITAWIDEVVGDGETH